MSVRTNIDASVANTASIGPQAVASNTTVNGSSVDLGAAGRGARVLVVAQVGTRTDGTYTFTIQDSADNSSFADAAAFSGSLTAISAASTVRTASFVPTAGRPYVRVKCVSTSVTTGAVVSAALLTVPAALV